DLEELETNDAAGGIGKLAVVETDTSHRAQQNIGHRMKPQPQLIGAHGGGRGAIGIEVELALLDPVLHLAAGAVDLLVEVFGFALDTPQRGHDKARISLVFGELGLGYDPTPAAPAAACPPPELLEVPRRLAGPPALRLGARQLACDLGNQPLILLQTEQE